MFSTLGLFGSTACEAVPCRRVGCPFAHGAGAGKSKAAADARRLLGFGGGAGSVTAVRGTEMGGLASTRKREAATDEVGQAEERGQQQRPAKAAKVVVGSRPGTSSTVSSRPMAASKSASRSSTIASLRAQAREAAVPALTAKPSSSSSSSSSTAAGGRPNAVASSSRTTLDPPLKSSLLTRPAPAFGVASVRSSASVPPKVTTVVRPTCHLIPTTARSSGPPPQATSRAQQAELGRPSKPSSSSSGQTPAPASRRPQPDAPRLSLRPTETVVPLKTRNKGLDVLFKEFLKLYVPLEGTDGWELVGLLAGEDALAQEAECYAKGGKTGYANAITNTMTAIRKRPSPTSTSHPSVGLQSAYIKTLSDLTASAASRLTAPVIAALVHPRAELERYGYVVEVPRVEGGERPTEEGQLKVCDRCKVEFVVGEQGHAKCWYHWGRARYGKEQGIRTQLATCCGVPWTNQGCTTSTYHVFKESDPLDLHARASFISSADLPVPAAPTRLDVVGLDCEMLYSTAGMTLARVTVVDEDGKSLLDELVRPDPARVLDHNTRFSGIKPGEVEEAAMNLDRVRDALGTLVGPETAIIGHGLENDLNALRLVHGKVIDTALLFPHPSGPPYRLALRDLMMKHLQKVIQNAGASGEGHSSLEDAAGSVELVRQRAKEMRERQA